MVLGPGRWDGYDCGFGDCMPMFVDWALGEASAWGDEVEDIDPSRLRPQCRKWLCSNVPQNVPQNVQTERSMVEGSAKKGSPENLLLGRGARRKWVAYLP